MGFFDKLKQMVGVSGIKVNLLLPQDCYKQGETISGVIKLIGGPEAKLANKLSVTLVESYPQITTRTVPAQAATESQPAESPEDIKIETVTSQTARHQQVILDQQFQIPAQAALEYPISLNLPAQAAVNGPSQEWRLKTELDIDGSFDPADNDRLTVTPDDQMQSARELVCKAAGFPANCLLRIEAIDASGERVSNRLYYL